MIGTPNQQNPKRDKAQETCRLWYPPLERHPHPHHVAGVLGHVKARIYTATLQGTSTIEPIVISRARQGASTVPFRFVQQGFPAKYTHSFVKAGSAS